MNKPAMKVTTEKRKFLQVNDLRTYYHTRHAIIRALDGINFEIDEDDSLALIGESGCGKSTIAHTIMKLL
ncbi:MAG: ATP-binding cassette domain-containing protein, partial [Spirochaetota bacterium]